MTFFSARLAANEAIATASACALRDWLSTGPAGGGLHGLPQFKRAPLVGFRIKPILATLSEIQAHRVLTLAVHPAATKVTLEDASPLDINLANDDGFSAP